MPAYHVEQHQVGPVEDGDSSGQAALAVRTS